MPVRQYFNSSISQQTFAGACLLMTAMFLAVVAHGTSVDYILMPTTSIVSLTFAAFGVIFSGVLFVRARALWAAKLLMVSYPFIANMIVRSDAEFMMKTTTLFLLLALIVSFVAAFWVDQIKSGKLLLSAFVIASLVAFAITTLSYGILLQGLSPYQCFGVSAALLSLGAWRFESNLAWARARLMLGLLGASTVLILNPELSRILFYGSAVRSEASRTEAGPWNSSGRIEIVQPDDSGKQKYVLFNGSDKGVRIFAFDGLTDEWAALKQALPENAYLHLAPSTLILGPLMVSLGDRDWRALVVGPVGVGAAKAALAFSATQVSIAEPSKPLSDFISEKFSKQLLAFKKTGRVQISNLDGRAVASRAHEKAFDLIAITSPYLSVHSAYGGVNLAPDFDWTKQAMSTYFGALTAGGVLAYHGPIKTSFAATVGAFAADLGIKDVYRHVVIVRQAMRDVSATALIRKTPWTASDLTRLEETLQKMERPNPKITFNPITPYSPMQVAEFEYPMPQEAKASFNERVVVVSDEAPYARNNERASVYDPNADSIARGPINRQVMAISAGLGVPVYRHWPHTWTYAVILMFFAFSTLVGLPMMIWRRLSKRSGLAALRPSHGLRLLSLSITSITFGFALADLSDRVPLYGFDARAFGISLFVISAAIFLKIRRPSRPTFIGSWAIFLASMIVAFFQSVAFLSLDPWPVARLGVYSLMCVLFGGLLGQLVKAELVRINLNERDSAVASFTTYVGSGMALGLIIAGEVLISLGITSGLLAGLFIACLLLGLKDSRSSVAVDTQLA